MYWICSENRCQIWKLVRSVSACCYDYSCILLNRNVEHVFTLKTLVMLSSWERNKQVMNKSVALDANTTLRCPASDYKHICCLLDARAYKQVSTSWFLVCLMQKKKITASLFHPFFAFLLLLSSYMFFSLHFPHDLIYLPRCAALLLSFLKWFEPKSWLVVFSSVL